MGGGNRQDSRALAHPAKRIGLREACHEFTDPRTRWWHVSTDHVVFLRSRPPRTRSHEKEITVRFEAQHRLRRIAIELSVQGKQKIGCGRLAELSSRGAVVPCARRAA